MKARGLVGKYLGSAEGREGGRKEGSLRVRQKWEQRRAEMSDQASLHDTSDLNLPFVYH